MKHKIITISRQFGSGGRTIGREVAARLGIPCYDHELIEKIAEESGFAKEYIAERGEYASHGSWMASAFSDRDFYGHSNQDTLWSVQTKIITELAEQGPCVIVGRCAAYCQFYTDMKWGAMEQYHIALDSGALGIETCVRILADLYQSETN